MPALPFQIIVPPQTRNRVFSGRSEENVGKVVAND